MSTGKLMIGTRKRKEENQKCPITCEKINTKKFKHSVINNNLHFFISSWSIG